MSDSYRYSLYNVVLESSYPIGKMPICKRKTDYRLINEKQWAGNKFKWNFEKISKEKIPIIIEVHSHLFMDLDDSFSWKSQVDGLGRRHLIPEDFFIHLCGHLVYQHNFSQLYWLRDIDQFLRKYQQSMDWRFLRSRAKILKLEKSIDLAIFASSIFFETPMSPAYLDYKNIERTLWSRLLTHEFLLYPRRSPLNYYLIKHLKNHSLYQALRYDLLNISHRIKSRIPFEKH